MRKKNKTQETQEESISMDETSTFMSDIDLGGVWEGWNMQVVCTAIHVSWFCFSGANLFALVLRKWFWAHAYYYEPKL